MAVAANEARMNDGSIRRGIVLVGHGGVPRDYPRERLMQLRGLEARRRATGAPPSPEELVLDGEMRHWPRTPTTDPYQAGLQSLAAHLQPRLESTRLVLAYNEFCTPTLAEAVGALAREGINDIVVVPSMFTQGGVHAEIEIPEAIDQLRSEFPRLRLRYAWPFAGEHLAAFFIDHLRRFDAR